MYLYQNRSLSDPSILIKISIIRSRYSSFVISFGHPEILSYSLFNPIFTLSLNRLYFSLFIICIIIERLFAYCNTSTKNYSVYLGRMEYAGISFPIYGKKIIVKIRLRFLWYNNYLYSDSYKSEILVFNAFATFSMTSIVGDVSPVSIRCNVDLLTPLFSANRSNVHPLFVRACHSNISIFSNHLGNILSSGNSIYSGG